MLTAYRPLLAATRANFCGKSVFSSSILHSRLFYFQNSTPALARWQSNSTQTQTNRFSVLKAIGAVGIGLGLSIFGRPPIHCEGSLPASPVAPTPDSELPPPPASSVNLYELSFGTVAGICAGVFIKKGAKAVAFFLGGVFVLLQYFGSFGVLKVDWQAMGTRFQRLFYTTDAETGSKATPTIYTAWKWLVDFLTADFQPRASFIAGLALGLRIG
ncbi:FUN14 family-domain-containing protein [Mycena maculata]|uniref:FUN14 family-domain-containing protein n=1 Tax=Mycena maculata TaxID=230809 RepID=A0AAD7IDM6_9AGAR|nr:FUN14 family-domain-containing protein [Mycena maculata]